ncbi:MAG: class I SAM-dependent methyltransferase [Candidatus Omnitrophica bacterium]|nr:class I SAM-dependent methyltransferase [Candidatus Omnitrophota bacterium]
MSVKNCRVCGNRFFQGALLQYKNMPKVAQFLPEKGKLKSDKGVNLRVYQCSGCGLVQLDSGPVPYYKEVIRAVGFSREMMNFRQKQFASLIDKFSLKGKKVIEIGCGCGEYLSIMQECGVQAYGLEYSRLSVARCIKNGLKASRGFIRGSTEKLKYAPFDAFYILSFLEHLPDPNSVLRGIFNNLRDGAVGLVEVPNFDMILRNKIFSEFMTDHLFYFTKETLATALRLNGFRVIECNQVWRDYIISAVVKKGERLDLADFYKYQVKLKNEVEGYLRRFKNKKVAIWGAGHQALAVIALLNLSGKIQYVIDSAPFKQGKFTPATHIPIVAPDILKLEPPDAVIIMAAGYSNEVARIIRKKFDGSIDIAIFRDYGLEII